ncbi:unnamed protein product [Arabis nemorensis]|uniref:Uncharacterized protein n=1 Tax=Arabis nemorensis TaxID=586526 RepID=A0A565ASS6_9BRAS|nr:unnamed protein product [Arabis nemorensis]
MEEEENYSYQVYEDEWSQEDNSDQDISTNGAEYSWYDDVYSESSSEEEPHGEEFEPEPLDHSQDDTSQYNRPGEETHQGDDVEEDKEGESWCYETDYEINVGENGEIDSWRGKAESHFSLEEGGYEDEPEHGEFIHREDSNQLVEPSHEYKLWCELTYSQISEGEAQHHEDEIWNREEGPEDNFSDESNLEEEEDPEHIHSTNQFESWEHTSDDEVEFESYPICFSGHSQGPEAYLRWERDMEDWLQANNIPEEEKTSYAEDTFTEDAFREWDLDANIRVEYDVPDAT